MDLALSIQTGTHQRVRRNRALEKNTSVSGNAPTDLIVKKRTRLTYGCHTTKTPGVCAGPATDSNSMSRGGGVWRRVSPRFLPLVNLIQSC